MKSPETDSENKDQSHQRLVTPVVICALLGAVAFNLWHLFPETTGGSVPSNDRMLHLLLIESAVDAMTHWNDFTDPWQGTMSMGFPLFHHYQHLPHVSVALIHTLTFQIFPVIDLMRWVTYLLISLFPLSLYWSLRRFSFDPLTCAMGGLLASLIGSDILSNFGGFGYVNYVFDGWGLYAQLWGMVLLPIALAFGYQTVRTGQGYFWATLLLSATLMSHLVYGYMAFLTLGFLTFVPIAPITFNKAFALAVLEHWKRLLILFVLVVSVTLYFIVPFILDQEHFANFNFTDITKDSFGHQVVLEALVKGNLFDIDRFPVFSILVFVGIGVCIFNWRKTYYLVPLVAFVLWLLLFFGRTTWGPLIDLLPFSDTIHMHRFIGGVHLSGIMLAGIALAFPWRWAVSQGNVRYIVGVLALTLLILSPLYIERRSYLSDNAEAKQVHLQAMQSEQEAMDKVIETLQELPPGRVYAGLLPFYNSYEFGERWGEVYRIGGTPVLSILGVAGFDVFASNVHGYSLPSGVLYSFNETSLEQFNLFNIRYVVAPEDFQPEDSTVPDFMKPVAQFGRHRIFQVETSGYFDLVGSILQFSGEQSAHFSAAQAWLGSGLLELKRHPQMSISGSPKLQKEGERPNTVISAPALSVDSALSSQDELDSYISEASAGPSRGSIISENIGRDYFSTTVNVERESMLMLKVTYHPNWRATVDGSKVDTVMLMPGFTGVQLAPGEHQVIMEYRSRNLRKILLGFGLIALISIGLIERRKETVSAWLGPRISAAIPSITKGNNNTRAGRRRRRR
ncbi:MAG: YfhO family protein [Chloroflexi bacterium]|nr:YfhO family protein [Chloroflexota bacterium]